VNWEESQNIMGFFGEMLNTPMEHCPASFLGLTVQPCDEPCGSAAGFDFLTVEVIQIGKKMPFLSA
jgi:hypothetical protein